MAYIKPTTSVAVFSENEKKQQTNLFQRCNLAIVRLPLIGINLVRYRNYMPLIKSWEDNDDDLGVVIIFAFLSPIFFIFAVPRFISGTIYSIPSLTFTKKIRNFLFGAEPL